MHVVLLGSIIIAARKDTDWNSVVNYQIPSFSICNWIRN